MWQELHSSLDTVKHGSVLQHNCTEHKLLRKCSCAGTNSSTLPCTSTDQQGFQALEDADAAHTSTHLQVAPGFAPRTRRFSCNKLTWATALVLPSESTALTHLLSDLARGAGAALACNH